MSRFTFLLAITLTLGADACAQAYPEYERTAAVIREAGVKPEF